MSEVEIAKEILRKAGFFTDNLWHVDDVKLKFNVTDDEDAQAILNTALTNDWIMEQIHYGIAEAAEDDGFLELKEEDDDEE
jgi:hypothetical protein